MIRLHVLLQELFLRAHYFSRVIRIYHKNIRVENLFIHKLNYKIIKIRNYYIHDEIDKIGLKIELDKLFLIYTIFLRLKWLYFK